MTSISAVGVNPRRVAKPQRTRLPEFDYFRGIGILMVMVGHATWDMTGDVTDYFRSLISGGTYFFLFISGFFFYLIFRQNFRYAPFFLKRTKYILLPFLVVTLVTLSLAVLIAEPMGWGTPLSVLASKFELLRDRGRLYISHWYVLFIVGVFALSPLFLRFADLKRRSMSVVLILMFIVSGLAHRPLFSTHSISFHGMIHYGVFYMFGIFYAKYRENLDHYRKAILVVGIGVALFALFQAIPINGPHQIAYHKQWWVYQGWDWQATQKAALCLPLVYLCSSLRKSAVTSFLFWCAQLSFGFYLLHEPIQRYARALVRYLPVDPDYTASDSLFTVVVSFLAGLIGSVLVIVLVRKIFGRDRSRMLVGS